MRQSVAKIAIVAGFAIFSICTFTVLEASDDYQPIVVRQFLQQAKKNQNWKVAFATAKDEQIVFMNISSDTASDNEIGEQEYAFDQAILVVQGKGKAVLNGKTSYVNAGDLIFVPEGTLYNLINSDRENELKVIGFYSENEVPEKAVFKKRTDRPKDD